jgi:hypothetical protein
MTLLIAHHRRNGKPDQNREPQRSLLERFGRMEEK